MVENLTWAWMGKSTPRVEDARLLRGAGKFLDDLKIGHALVATFVRSPIAHGKIKSIGLEAARSLPGVRAVLEFADIRPLLTNDRIPMALPSGAIRFDVNPPVLAYDEVCYVGEPLAIVVAETRGIAEDAAALVQMTFDPLPPLMDPKEAVAKGASKVRQECTDNLPARHVVKYGDADKAFKTANYRIKDSFRLRKGGGHSIEPRGVIAIVDETGVLTLWDSTQMPHRAKAILVEALGMSEDKVRVIAPDVGGGFGPKAVFHPEELAIAAAAIKLGVPIKWVEDRFESFTASCQEHVQVWDMEAAFDIEGKLLAIRGCLYHGHGSSTPYGVPMPYNAATNLIGPYVLPAYDIDILLCMTNQVPSTPTRGAGRPQGTFVMERLLDRAADDISIDRTEIRRRNLIQPGQMPYATPVIMRDGSYMTYDSGNYPECQRRALEQAGFADFPRRQREARAKGIRLGLGVSNYVEGTGRGPFESASLRIGPSGKVIVTTGATAQGQGVKSMLAQIAGGVLGLDPCDIHVVDGDTNGSPLGLGAYGSRQTVTAGNSMFVAANLVATKARAMASHTLEGSPDDRDLIGGKICVKGAPGLQVSLGDVAKVLGGMPGYAIPGGMDPGLSASVDFPIRQLTFTNGSHAVEVSVDPETGLVKILRYLVVHDCGNMINPMMVEGQVRGGVVHGIGMTLFEWMRYDEQGQPTSVTYADYLLPTCDVVPSIEIHHLVSPSPLNPLGVKGAGESGTIGAASAIVSAIENALRPLSVRILELPVTPAKLRALIATAQRAD